MKVDTHSRPGTHVPSIRAPYAGSGGKKGQGPAATLAFLAFLAMWFV
jgi:hypothetical protein